jgi:hypothetical protein
VQLGTPFLPNFYLNRLPNRSRIRFLLHCGGYASWLESRASALWAGLRTSIRPSKDTARQGCSSELNWKRSARIGPPDTARISLLSVYFLQ